MPASLAVVVVACGGGMQSPNMSGFGGSSQMPNFMPNSLGRPPMPNSSPMLPGMSGSQPPQQMMGSQPQQMMGSQPRFGAVPLPQQVNNGGNNGGGNKAQYAPAGLAARGVNSPYDDQGQNWNNGGNQMMMQQQQSMMGGGQNDMMMMGGGGNGGNGGGGGGGSGSNMRDNVHLIDEQDIQLMKVNGMPERIGEGAYGIVYRGEWTFDKESADLVDPWLERRSNRVVTVAVKQLGGSSPDKEIAVWTTLRHPNIVPLFGLVDSLKEKLVMPYCVPEEHEVLTSRGFMDLDTYLANQDDKELLVASYDVDAKQMRFERPVRLVQFERETRQMVELSHAADADSHGRSNGVSMLVTLDHDLYVAGADKKYAKVKAAEVLKGDSRFDALSQLAQAENGVGAAATALPFAESLELNSPERVSLFMELYGFWLGHGSATRALADGRRLARFAQVKAEDIAWLEERLCGLGVAFDKVGQREIVVKSVAWGAVLHVDDDVAAVASWVWQLSTEQLRSVIAGVRRAEGAHAAAAGDGVIYTSSTRFRDELVRICLMAGYSTQFHKAAGTSDCWAVLYQSGRVAGQPTLYKSRGEVRAREYTGRVWCFTMPSGMIWVRRAEKDASGVVTKASRPVLTGNCNGVSLRRRLTDLPQECSERRFQLRVLRDVAAGVAYLHEKNIVHRDLAARNVLLHRFRGTSPDQEVALLADFGLTRKIDAKAQYNAANFNVPLQPLAPEQLLDYHNGRAGCRSTPQSDVWAFGVLCAELLLPQVDQFYGEVTANCGSNTGAWIECVYQYVTVDCRTPLDDFNLNEATVDVVAVAKRCMQHNDIERPMMKDIYRQLREQCDQPEPKTVGDVPKALYGSSELDIVVREAIEGERQFARRLDVLFNVFEKELQACTMSDTPVMTIADIKVVFRNSGALYQAANTLQQTLAQCERANFGAVMLDALKKTKFDKVVGEYLKGVLQGQALLYELMYPKQRQMKKRADALQLFLDQQSAARKAKGLNLPDLLSCPYAHLTEMKRMLARIMTHTESKTDKAALEEATKLLNGDSARRRARGHRGPGEGDRAGPQLAQAARRPVPARGQRQAQPAAHGRPRRRDGRLAQAQVAHRLPVRRRHRRVRQEERAGAARAGRVGGRLQLARPVGVSGVGARHSRRAPQRDRVCVRGAPRRAALGRRHRVRRQEQEVARRRRRRWRGEGAREVARRRQAARRAEARGVASRSGRGAAAAATTARIAWSAAAAAAWTTAATATAACVAATTTA
jgi:serine/threonine protein kinase